MTAILALAGASPVNAEEARFAGIVSSATPEATAAGVSILESGGNAVDAAIATSLALAVSEPAGSGIAGQTVMLIKRPHQPAQVIQGTTWSPRELPESITDEDLRSGRTASTVPSTLAVLDVAFREFGSGSIGWPALVAPAARIASDGFIVGSFRHRSFRAYAEDLRRQPEAATIFLGVQGAVPQVGDVIRQPLLANTLQQIAIDGATSFYKGSVAKDIVRDMKENGGWITAEDLAKFPKPKIVPAISTMYRGHVIETLPPPFGGWVVLQALELLELQPPATLGNDDSERRLALIDALGAAHASRRSAPVTDYEDYEEAIEQRLSPETIQQIYHNTSAGETTHFTVADADGVVVSVTQSIDSYFGARVVHPRLGFLYNNYMQGFQVDNPEAPYFIEAQQMPLSSMSATVVSRDGVNLLGLGSPGSARIISAVLQVTSHWIDVGAGIESAVGAWRVHALPPDRAWVEGPELDSRMLAGLASRELTLVRPAFGVSDSQYDPYFGGVHALAREGAGWNGAADPRRDGEVGVAYKRN